MKKLSTHFLSLFILLAFISINSFADPKDVKWTAPLKLDT
jgi:hypothetical protein